MASKFKKIFEVNFLIANVLVPLIALALYCISFAYFSSLLLLKGVSYHFTYAMGKYAFAAALVSSLIFFAALKWNKDTKLEFKRSAVKFRLEDLILPLFPLTPVVQYMFTNRDILSAAEFVYVTAFFIIFSCMYIFAIPIFFGTFMPNLALMSIGMAFVYLITNMASASSSFAWFGVGNLGIQLALLAGVFFAAWLLYAFHAKWILHFFILLNLAANTSTQVLSRTALESDPSSAFEENELLSRVVGKTPVITPNIYLLIYDAYVPNETMLSYGIDNSAQENYLRDAGFVLYPHTYSVSSNTLGTMSRVLNASTNYYGDKHRAVSGDGVTQRIFHELGYETYGLFFSDYMFRGYGENYDHAFPTDNIPPFVQLVRAILMGEFRFDLGGGRNTHEQFIDAKRDIFKNVSLDQVFIYMHTDLPSHSQESGACLPDETELFSARLKNANVEMRQDLDLIIQNDPGAIVIVAGDHGPYLTRNCHNTSYEYDISEISRMDIQDRYATFLAIRWPNGDFVKYDEITVLQDLFPSIFAYMYQDTTILKAKIRAKIPSLNTISGASVENGYIIGGPNDGEPLFLSEP
jgi:hypothetical protein